MASIPFRSDSLDDRPGGQHWEWQYLDLMRRIWEQGDERIDRTGIGTRSLFGAEMRFDLTDGKMPLLSTKRVFWKTATREMLWFLTGDTNIRELCAQNVQIWTDWPLDRYRRETGETRRSPVRRFPLGSSRIRRLPPGGEILARFTVSNGPIGRCMSPPEKAFTAAASMA